MQNGHVVYKAHVSHLHSCFELVLASNEVNGIKSLCLFLSETRYALGSRGISMASQKAAREIEKHFSLEEV